jgi:hypothetical protein
MMTKSKAVNIRLIPIVLALFPRRIENAKFCNVYSRGSKLTTAKNNQTR